MDDQPPNVAVAALADAQKGLLAPGRMLCRNEAQPRGQIARLAELPTVPCGCDDRRRAKWPDAGDMYGPPRYCKVSCMAVRLA